MTGHQVAALARAVPLSDRGVLVALDGDPAGRNASVRAYAQLVPATTDLRAITFREGYDPASTVEQYGRDGLRETLIWGARPLADLVTDAAIDRYAHGRELVFAELQMGALRAAATVVAAMPPDHVGPQAARLCFLYAEKYGWTYEEVNREIIEAVDRHFRVIPHDPSVPPWGTVLRATAPPRPRRSDALTSVMGQGCQPRQVPRAELERG